MLMANPLNYKVYGAITRKYFCIGRINILRSLHNKKLTHYEVLGLSNSCTQTDIKKAFILLSKKLHPDKQAQSEDNNANHVKFVALNDAYTTLSKRNSRALYDASLKRVQGPGGYRVQTNAPDEKIIFQDDTFWEHRDRSEDARYTGRPYYGVSWIKNKQPNSHVVTGVVIFMIMGMIGQYFIAKWWTSFTQEQAENRTQKIARIYKEIRERATNETRMNDHMQKLKEDTRRNSEK